MQVDFITLGDAAERLKVAAPTLREWCNALEEMNIHYLERNNRDERIFFDSDMEIFRYIQDQKKTYGKRTRTKDLAYVIRDTDTFKLRTLKEKPDLAVYRPQHGELAPSDMEAIIHNPRFKEILEEMLQVATARAKEELRDEVLEVITQDQVERRQSEEKRDKQTTELLAEIREQNKLLQDYMELPAWKRLFYKPK